MSKEKVKDFQKFGGISYDTLKYFNAKEAKKAMARAARQVPQTPALGGRRSSFFQESIIYNAKKGY